MNQPLAGVISLWIAAFRRTTQFIAVGLALGMITIAPFTYHTLTLQPSMNDSFVKFAFVSPFMVAGVLLVGYVLSKFGRASDRTVPDDLSPR